MIPTESQQEALLQKLEGWLRGKIASGEATPAYLAEPGDLCPGSYLVLDFGGTNLRAEIVELSAGRRYRVVSTMKRSLRDSRTDFFHPASVATDLFDFIVETIRLGMQQPATAAKASFPLAHVFSYPVQQDGLNSARLLQWTKELKVQGVVGEDVQQLLRAALERGHITGVDPVVVLNDTVAVLMAGSYSYPGCRIGAVAGTGYNAAAFLAVNPAATTGSQAAPLLAYNLEVGAFNHLPQGWQTPADLRLDQESRAPGEQLYEKMVGGAYLGESCRREAQELLAAKTETAVAAWLQRPYSIAAALVGSIGDPGAGEADWEAALASLAPQDEGMDMHFLQAFLAEQGPALQTLAEDILGRAGVMAALPLVALARMDLGVISSPRVLVEGSLYSGSRIFRDNMDATLKNHGLEPCSPLTGTVSLGGAVAAAASVYKNVVLL